MPTGVLRLDSPLEKEKGRPKAAFLFLSMGYKKDVLLKLLYSFELSQNNKIIVHLSLSCSRGRAFGNFQGWYIRTAGICTAFHFLLILLAATQITIVISISGKVFPMIISTRIRSL